MKNNLIRCKNFNEKSLFRARIYINLLKKCFLFLYVWMRPRKIGIFLLVFSGEISSWTRHLHNLTLTKKLLISNHSLFKIEMKSFLSHIWNFLCVLSWGKLYRKFFVIKMSKGNWTVFNINLYKKLDRFRLAFEYCIWSWGIEEKKL